MLENLTLDQLRFFIAVAEEGSLAAAGRRLGRVQSAVAYGIGRLEENLGVSLFERSGRCVSLTEAGQALLADAEAVFERVGLLRRRAEFLASHLESHLTVALEAMLPADFVVGVCAMFKEQFPNVSLHLRTEGLGGVAAVVLDGSCDLGISGEYDIGELLRSRLLAHLPIVAVAASHHPLARERGPIPDERLRTEAQILIAHTRYGSGRAHNVLSDTVLSVAGAGIKTELILAGFGWGFMPLESARGALERGDLVTLHLEERGRAAHHLPIHAIVRRDAQLGPAAQWLYDALAREGALSAVVEAAA